MRVIAAQPAAASPCRRSVPTACRSLMKMSRCFCCFPPCPTQAIHFGGPSACSRPATNCDAAAFFFRRFGAGSSSSPGSAASSPSPLLATTGSRPVPPPCCNPGAGRRMAKHEWLVNDGAECRTSAPRKMGRLAKGKMMNTRKEEVKDRGSVAQQQRSVASAAGLLCWRCTRSPSTRNDTRDGLVAVSSCCQLLAWRSRQRLACRPWRPS
jgi:hypothetical protein